MSEAGHDLHSIFAQDGEIIHAFKLSNSHFQSLSNSYHDLTKQIGGIETGIAAASDEHLEGLKKQRLAILDEIAAMIERARADAAP